MTLEEAKQLKPGDVIRGPWQETDRTIVRCYLREVTLFWDQPNNNTGHSWPINELSIVKPVVINTYPIY